MKWVFTKCKHQIFHDYFLWLPRIEVDYLAFKPLGRINNNRFLSRFNTQTWQYTFRQWDRTLDDFIASLVLILLALGVWKQRECFLLLYEIARVKLLRTIVTHLSLILYLAGALETPASFLLFRCFLLFLWLVYCHWSGSIRSGNFFFLLQLLSILVENKIKKYKNLHSSCFQTRSLTSN